MRDILGRCFKLFVSADSASCHDFASQFGLDSFIRQKHPKPRGNRAASASVYFNGQRPTLSPAERAVTVGCQRIAITCAAAVCVCVCACVCTRACVRACVRACARVCMRFPVCVRAGVRAGVRASARACVRAIYDNNI